MASPCDSGESERLQRARNKAEQGNKKKNMREEGRGYLELCYESAMAKKKEAVTTSTGDQQGKIRQAMKQHSSASPCCSLKQSPDQGLWEDGYIKTLRV